MGFLLCEFSSCCVCAFRLGLHPCEAWGCVCWSAFRAPVLTHTCSNTLKCVFLWQDLSANRRLTSRSERGGGFPLPVLQCVWEEDGCYHDLWIGQQFPTGQRWQEWLERGMQLGFFFGAEGFTGRNGRMTKFKENKEINLHQPPAKAKCKRRKKKKESSKDKMPWGPLCLHFPFCQSVPPSTPSLSLTQMAIPQWLTALWSAVSLALLEEEEEEGRVKHRQQIPLNHSHHHHHLCSR